MYNIPLSPSNFLSLEMYFLVEICCLGDLMPPNIHCTVLQKCKTTKYCDYKCARLTSEAKINVFKKKIRGFF